MEADSGYQVSAMSRLTEGKDFIVSCTGTDTRRLASASYMYDSEFDFQSSIFHDLCFGKHVPLTEVKTFLSAFS